MKKLITILLVLIAAITNGQTIANAKPLDGYYNFLDSTKLSKPLLTTSYATGATLHFLMRDTTNSTIYNYTTVASLASSLGSSFIVNGTAQQTSANFNIDGNGVAGAFGIGATPTGNNGIYLISKNFYQQGHVSDNSEVIADFRANNGGQRVSIYGGGLTTMGYSAAPSVQSGTSLYLNKIMLGNDDAGYITISRYNGGTPYAYFQAVQSSSTAGTAGYQFHTSNSGSDVSAFQINAVGTLTLPQYGAGTLTTDGSGNVTATSDNRVKHDIRPMNYGLKELMKVEPSTFIYNKDSSKTVMPGFIAQNIRDAFNGLGVDRDKQGYLTLNTNVIIAALVNAIKEQQKEIEELKAIIKK